MRTKENRITINENVKLILLTLLYIAILFALFYIYAGGSVESNFIYNEF